MCQGVTKSGSPTPSEITSFWLATMSKNSRMPERGIPRTWAARYRTHRSGRHGPEPHPQHERPRLHRRGLQPHHVEKVDAVPRQRGQGHERSSARTPSRRWSKLKKPRRVMMLVKAGKPVDEFIEQLIPHLSNPGDIIIDGGNSLFEDTNRRVKYVESKGLLYIGTGVRRRRRRAQRPEHHARRQRRRVAACEGPIFQAISAKVEGVPCCDWVGEMGAGHYVKMVHNGIEYGDMQLICEAYNIMKNGLGMTRRRDARRCSPNGTRAISTATSSRSPATSSPRRTRTAPPWWTRSSTPPARRAPASGRSSTRRTSASRSP
jgi:3-hydroxyisobutyrate dehydrogenase-like beta-hydroxyacid dehydrogenase